MAQARGEDRWFPRWVLALAGVLLLGFLLYVLRGVLTPVFFAFLIAYMLDPVVDRFEERKLPRAVGIAVMLTIVLGAIALFLVLAVPGIVADVKAFMAELPGTVGAMVVRVEPWLAQMGIEMPQTLDEALERMQVDAGQITEKAVEPVGAAIRWLLGGTASMLGALVGAIMVPVLAAYLLHDFDEITAGIADLVPPKSRPYVVDMAKEVDQVLGAFIRGQLLVMLILAVAYSVAYSLLGVRLALVIGVVAGLLSFIPYLGGAVALGLALVMCLLDWNGWGQILGVVGAYTLIQLFEGFVITPKVVGDKVGLSPVWVLFALMVGGELFGFMGVLLALPAAAVIKIFVVRGLSWYRGSAFFLGYGGGSEEALLPGMLHAEGLPDDPDTSAQKQRARTDAPDDGPLGPG